MCASTFEEDLRPEDFPNYSDFVEETAYQKVLEVESRLSQMAEEKKIRKADIIIGADTMVTFDGECRITTYIACINNINNNNMLNRFYSFRSNVWKTKIKTRCNRYTQIVSMINSIIISKSIVEK